MMRVVKMERNNIPWCHGQKMTAIFRYVQNGSLWTTYQCIFCRHKQEVEDESYKPKEAEI